jgi:hypothetical protein
MNKLTRILALSVCGLLATVAVFAVGTRFTDGPLAVFTGGPFKSGEITKAPSDWSYLKTEVKSSFRRWSLIDPGQYGLLHMTEDFL